MISNEYTLIVDDLRVKTKPAFLHYAKGEYADAVRTVENLLAELQDSALSLESAEVHSCYLHFLRLNFMFARDGCWNSELVNGLVCKLQKPLLTPFGNHERINLLIQLVAHAGESCSCPMDVAQMRDLLADDQLLEHSSNLWHSLGYWGFVNDHMEVLAEAFENQTINPSESMPQEAWQRLYLMLLLRRGTATRQDVLEYIKLLRLVPQINELREIMLPIIQREGLWDAELASQMETMMVRALSGAYRFPREKRTGSLRG